MNRIASPLLIAALGLTAVGPAAAVQLQPGQPLAIELAAGSLSNAVFIDVPASAERLSITLDAGSATQDVDLLARFDTAFPNSTFTDAPPDAEWLLKQAHFQSISPGGNESIVITRASAQPLRAGRLYLSLINYSGQPAPTTLSARLGSASEFVPLSVVFDDARDDCAITEWQDPTPLTPVRGNSGTTLGEQRRLALLEAARLLSEELRPQAPVRIQACWAARDYSATSGGVLAFAGPRALLVNDIGAGAPFGAIGARYVTQFAPASAHQAGTAFCRIASQDCANTRPDIRASFNRNVDLVADTGRRFDYGFQHQAGTISFLSTAMHEIGHGLGFIGWLELKAEDGAQVGEQQTAFGKRYDDAYGQHAVIVDTAGTAATPLLRASVAERAAALTAFTTLRFAGPRTVTAPGNTFANFASPDNAARLHSPDPIAEGSTYSHLSSSHSGHLMTAALPSTAPRTLGLGRELLYDIGWDPTPKAVPAAVATPEGQYFDVARNGHGFDLRRISGVAGEDNLYFLLFYTYDANGRPEWYSSTGRVVDGAFQPARNATGDSLLRNLYRGQGQQPSTVADPDPGYQGDVRIDFADAARHPVCRDGAGGRQLEGTLAILSWEVDGVERQWCMQPLVASRAGVTVDFSSQWYDPSDGGWGMSVQSFPGSAGRDGVAIELYFPDAGGRGRWGLVQTDQLQAGQSYPVQQVSGYCRTCDAPAAQSFTPIGTMTLNLAAPGEGQSRVSIDVTYPGPEGGRFVRNNVPIQPVGAPGYRLP